MIIWGYKFIISQEKQFMYMDNMNIFAKNENEQRNLIQTVWLYCPNQEKHKNTKKKGNYKYRTSDY